MTMQGSHGALVRMERTGWRCQQISERHRLWGFHCPAVDLDFVVLEYNRAVPVALIEYKECTAPAPDLRHPTYRALRALADGYTSGPLPFLLAVYDTADWTFRVLPVNAAAQSHYGSTSWLGLSERQYVRSLYLLRTRALTAADEAALARLSDSEPRA